MNRLVLLATLVAAAALPSAGRAGCCGTTHPPQTLRQYLPQAPLVIAVTVTRCFEAANGGDSFITEMKVDQVLKAHAALGKQKVIHIPRQVEVDPKKPLRLLVLFDVGKDGKLDPFAGIPIQSPDLVDYVAKALALDPKDKPAQLQFFFAHLETADPVLAADAWQELENADRKDLIKAASRFSRVKLRAYLKSPKVPDARKKLYGFLLGACGIDADADLLKSLFDAKTATLDEGLLIGYTQLRSKDGWALMRKVLQDEKADFSRRYAAMRVMRYLHSDRPDLVSRKEVVAGMCLLLPQADISDLAIDDLRRWKCWEPATDILNLDTLESHHSVPIVRRAIPRYALSAKHIPAAKAFVEEQRKKDAELVDDTIEFLKLEDRLDGGDKK